MIKTLSKLNRPIFGILLIFLLSFLVRLIKSWYFPFWHDEIVTLLNTNSFTQALEFARTDHIPPLLYLFTTAIKLFFGDNPIVLRLPHILAGALTITFVYGLFLSQGFKRPFWLTLPLVFHFILVYYSQEIRFYSLIVLLSLLSFWLGFELIFGKPFRPWLALVLGPILAFLSLLHYITFTHLLTLGVALILIWLLQRDFKSWRRVLYLLGSYSIVLISNLAWADEILDNLQAKFHAPEQFFFNFDVLRRLAYKLAGGGGIWTTFIVGVFGLILLFWFYRWLIQRRSLPFLSQEGFEKKDSFVFFLLVYLLVYFFLFWGFGSERIIFHRYFLFLFWPFAFILLAGVDLVLASRFKLFQVLAATFILIFIVSHLLLLRAYWLSSYRVEDFRTSAQFIDRLVENGKTKVYLSESDPRSTATDLKFYLKVYQDEIYSGFEEVQKPNAKEFFKGSLYLYFGSFPLKEVDQTREAQLSQIFENKKVFWEDKNFEYLATRCQHPFLQEGTLFITAPGRYKRLVIFW